MIYTNALSVFILHHHLNGVGNKNLCSIQDVMCASKPEVKMYKMVCEDFPNLVILTKSATPGKIQLTVGRADVENKSLGGSFLALTIVGDISSPSVIYLKIEIAFATGGNKIHLPIAEFLLRAATSNLTRSEKQRYWTPRNAVFLPPFLAEDAILHRSLPAS